MPSKLCLFVGRPKNGVWRDANGDGQMQPNEIQAFPGVSLTENIAQFGGTFFPGGAFIKGERIFNPAGLDAKGVPLYPAPNDAPAILQGQGEMTKYSNWMDVWPSLQSDWKEFYASASLPASNGGWDGSGGDSIIRRFDRNGDIKWRYRRVKMGYAMQAPLSKIGDLYGALRIAGEVQTPGAGEVVSIRGVYRRGTMALPQPGPVFVLHQDQIRDTTTGAARRRTSTPSSPKTFPDISSVTRKKRRVLPVLAATPDGLHSRTARMGHHPTVPNPAENHRRRNFQQENHRRKERNDESVNREPLAIAQATPQRLTGDLAGWNQAALGEIALDETTKAKVRLAYDTKNLRCALFHVPDSSPWQNGASDWKYVFKGGDAVDIQLGTDWSGPTKRVAQAGDVRIFLAPAQDGAGTRVVAMWPIAPAGTKSEPMLYKSPVAEERFGGVALLQNVETHLTKTTSGYTIAAAIPWSELGMTGPNKYRHFTGRRRDFAFRCRRHAHHFTALPVQPRYRHRERHPFRIAAAKR